MDSFKKELIEVGRWIWEKDLSGANSGNISVRLSSGEILITARGTCLGMLESSQVGRIGLDGGSLDKGFVPSSEKLFHMSVYQGLEARAVVHVHPTFCNAYFAVRGRIDFDTFETRLTLGDVPVIDQKTPTITDIAPVIKALENSNIVVLKNHGVVAVGETLREAFFLAQTLEEAAKISCIKEVFSGAKSFLGKIPDVDPHAAASCCEDGAVSCCEKKAQGSGEKLFDIFSDEQIEAIVRAVNQDKKFEELSLQTNLETKLAVVLDETGCAYCFHFSGGKIKGFVKDSEGAEFVISGKGDYWKAIFQRRLDPFAATTQKKLKLKGDFAKISRWYVPFNRLFDLWTSVPVK